MKGGFETLNPLNSIPVAKGVEENKNGVGDESIILVFGEVAAIETHVV